jgi:hypothetical protein
MIRRISFRASGGKSRALPPAGAGGTFRENDFFRKAPYSRFEEFIAPDADRLALLVTALEENGLKPRILDAGGRSHVVLGAAKPPHRGGGAGRPIVLSAHYDRAADSPGANDNSAAVFMLIEAAADIFGRGGGAHGSASGGAHTGAADAPVIIFTDKEELSCGEGLKEQGAYSLALRLKEQGLKSARIFCFDACGAGNTLVISTEADQLLRNETSVGAARIRRRVWELRNTALETARRAGIEKILLLPTPFSDDAGFFRAGLAAQTITVLPETEAAAFASRARAKPETVSALVCEAPGEAARNAFPETWRNLNGPGDTPSLLTPKYWKNMVRFVKTLCRE